MKHTINKGYISSRTNSHILIGVCCTFGKDRIDYNELRAVSILCLQQMLKADRICHSGVCTKNYHHFGVCCHIGEVICHSTITPSIRHTGDCCAMSNPCYVVYIISPPKGCKLPKIVSLLIVKLR